MAINIDPAHKGLLHKELGVAADKKIPAKKLAKAAKSSNPVEKKRAVFAENAKKWNHPKDTREGRLSDVKTDRGEFRFKANKKGE